MDLMRAYEFRLPGSYVVLQGIPGDGMSNTMDRLPSNSNVDVNNTTTATTLLQTSPRFFPLPLNMPTSRLVTEDTLMTISTDENTFDVVTSSTDEVDSDDYIVVSENDNNNNTAMDVSNATSTNTLQQPTSANLQSAIQAWQRDCRQHEWHHRTDWLESAAHYHSRNAHSARGNNNGFAASSTINYDASRWWWQTCEGQLTLLDKPAPGAKIIRALPPGTTLVASQLITLDSATLQELCDESTALVELEESSVGALACPPPRPGWIQLLKVEVSNVTGYVVLSCDGYPFLGPGLPSLYTSSWWRVTCPDGALIRQGLDLGTALIEKIPYGSLLCVKRKTINSMGLSRLQVETMIPCITSCNSNEYDERDTFATGTSSPTVSYMNFRKVQGWCSEFLNPLSGQRGPVVQPLSFPTPAIFRVVLPEGAIVRQDVELTSPVIKTIPCGNKVAIVGRVYTEHPKDHCLERFKLAGNGGYISVRLNKQPPLNSLVVELQGVDTTFDPANAGLYHLMSMQQQNTQASLPPSTRMQVSPDISSIGDDEDEDLERRNSIMFESMQNITTSSTSLVPSISAPPTTSLITPSSSGSLQQSQKTTYSGGIISQDTTATVNDKRCLICLTDDRNATIIHGETGHIASCLRCARILMARKSLCPVCRQPIDLVVQHFWA